MDNTSILFQPFISDKLQLKNKIVMAPMTRSFSPEGIPTNEVATYYARRAQYEVGLIITEGTVVNRISSSNDPNIPHFYGEKSLEGWRKVVELVHAKEGKIAPQLWHMGIVPYLKSWKPPEPMEGPSGLINPETKGGKEMTREDIEVTISAFAEAAYQAKKLGFDAVEIHGAHGYLIDQFFWHKMNKRTDEWGGETIAERSRFAVEIIKAVRSSVGEDFPVILRLSQWKQQEYTAKIAHTPKEMEEWLLPLSDAGVDMFHCSQRRFWEPEFKGSDLNFAGWTKKITKKPSITVGSVGLSSEFPGAFRGESSQPYPIDGLLTRLNNQEFDLVAIGRALLADPLWVLKVKDSEFSQLKGFSKEDLMNLY
ncbi:MAG: NADH:flavin oxidoreductase [Flavobacteriaceae bacterium]|jgi:2,4-dienoyl-CoA reductase-like NADH-dependent reductase (Old Yellow Enzyme family)|nr:NADH:flavin oxidoreductase [Flavobacteriaceae bacterium]